VVDPKEGRLSFTLRDQATILDGTHFMQLVFMNREGERLTTARINYYVGETMLDDMPGIESSSDYGALYTMYSQLSHLGTSEQERQDAENNRKTAEMARVEEYQSLKDDFFEYIENARESVETTETYMQNVEKMHNAIMEKQLTVVQEALVDLMLVTQEEAEALIEAATKDFNAGTFTDDEEEVKLLKMKTGKEANLPDLNVGEPAWASDTETMYVGGADGPVPIGGVYVAGENAPDRTDLLWIDTSAGNVIKYFNGTAWKATATATFA
jgi:predicted transcriptional regulator